MSNTRQNSNSGTFARGRLLAVAVMLACGMGPALAQGVTTTDPTETCAGFRNGGTLGCTANEATTDAVFTPVTGGGTCIAGGSVLVDVSLTLAGSNTDRQDYAFFAGIQGNDPQLATAGEICSVSTFTSASAAPWEDNDSDACFDFNGGGVGTSTASGITVQCDPDVNGNLRVPYVLTYQQNDGDVCTGPSDARAGTNSKCTAGVGIIEGITVNGYINVTKVTQAASGQDFPFTASGDAAPNPTAFTLDTDAGDQAFSNTQQVLMPITEGASRTLTIDETVPTGWSVASIVCTAPGGGSAAGYVTVNVATGTITAELNDVNVGADCTVTNTQSNPQVTLDKTTTASGYSALGNTLNYSYIVSNTGNVSLAGPVTVADNRATVTCPAVTTVGNNNASLDPGESIACTASYVVTQADIDLGSVVNTATATVGGTPSNPDTVTVTGTQTRTLALDKTTTSTGYNAAGQGIVYSYLVTNTGNTTLAGPVTVVDNRVTVTCPAGSLAPGASRTCTATYTTTQADITNGSVTNTATASANGVTSNTDSVTVQSTFVPFVDALPVPVDSRWVLVALALLLGFAAQRRIAAARRG